MSWADGSPNWLSDDEAHAWRAMLAVHKLLLRQLDRDLQSEGLSLNDYEILAYLSEMPGRRLRMTDLADVTCQSRSRLSHQISRIELRDLVRREECEGDKRGTWAVLTDEGMELLQRVAPTHVESVRLHFIDRTTPEQLELLRVMFEPIGEYLRKIRDRD